jgi:hypothetical protein
VNRTVLNGNLNQTGEKGEIKDLQRLRVVCPWFGMAGRQLRADSANFVTFVIPGCSRPFEAGSSPAESLEHKRAAERA